MNGAELKARARSGGVVYGTMLTSARHSRWAILVARLGLDYVIIDTEHLPRSRSELSDLASALALAGVVPIARVPIPASHYVTMALDAGAQGVLAPYCETVDQVKEVVGATKWRPLKGAFLRRVLDEGRFPSEETRRYLEELNRNNICIIGVESVPAVENLEALLSVPGVDAVFVGPNDLSISLGIPDRYDHPLYEETLRRIIATCRERGMPVMVHHQTVELTQKWLREGARWVLYSSESRAMHNAFRQEFNAIKAVGAQLGAPAEEIGEFQEEV